jgi:hypothetical protein
VTNAEKDVNLTVRRLTLKQRGFIQFIPTARSFTEAAKLAGYAHPNKIACHVINRLKNHPEFIGTVEVGAISTRLANSLAEGIKATRKYIWKGKAVGEFPDWGTRLKVARLAAKLMGFLK